MKIPTLEELLAAHPATAAELSRVAAVLRSVRRACEGLTLKVILESGELGAHGDMALITRASRLALAEGADNLRIAARNVAAVLRLGQSITGGYIYRGSAEAAQGQYFYADFVTHKLFTLSQVGGTWTAVERICRACIRSARRAGVLSLPAI